MGHNLIRDPAGMQLHMQREQQIPFSWNIAQFRGQRIGERPLVVCCRQVTQLGTSMDGVLVVMIVRSVMAVAQQPHLLRLCPAYYLRTPQKCRS
jgi:hypothetical protein